MDAGNTREQIASLGRCAVTGGSGWTGRVLMDRLREVGVTSVVAIDLVQASSGQDASFRACDITDKADAARALTDVDTVFHTVAFVDLRPTADEAFSMRLNVGGTENVLHGLITNGRPGAATFVNLGTSDVLMGAELMCVGKTEDEILVEPPSIYQRTKLLAEQVVHAACMLPASDGRRPLRGLTLRSPAIWGLNDRTFARMAPLPFRIGVPGARVDMIYVENLASALLHAAISVNERPEVLSGEAFNIRDGERNMQQLYRTELLGEPLPSAPAFVPHVMIGIARLLDACAGVVHTLSGLQIQAETGMTTVAMYCAWGIHTTSTAKAEQLLGRWHTIPHEEALKRTRAALSIQEKS